MQCSLRVSESLEPGSLKSLLVTGIIMEKEMLVQNVYYALSNCRLIIFSIATRVGEAVEVYLNVLHIILIR